MADYDRRVYGGGSLQTGSTASLRLDNDTQTIAKSRRFVKGKMNAVSVK